MGSGNTQFSVVSKRSIEMFAESVGIPTRNLGDSVVENLAEDATYRVREALQNAIRFMKHSKRRHLTVEDFNRALKWANVEQVYGHGGMDIAHFKPLSPKDTNLQVFYIEEKDINLRELSLDLSLPPDSGDVSVKAQWLVFEGITCVGGKLGKDEISWAKERLDEPYLVFLETLVAAVFDEQRNVQRKALQSIRELPQLQVVLPNLISFLVVKVKAADENNEIHLIVEQVLAIVKAVVENGSLFLNPYVLQIAKLLLFIVMEAHLDVPYWHFKRNAASIIATICRRHMITMHHLPHQLLKVFQDGCLDTNCSVESVYGAVVGLTSLGAEAVFQVLYPNMKQKTNLSLNPIIGRMREPSRYSAAVQLYGALMDAASLLVRKSTSSVNVKTSASQHHSPRNFLPMYFEFVEEFGERIVIDCVHCRQINSGRGAFQQGRNLKLSGLSREKDSFRNMIQTYLDSMKSTVCDRVESRPDIRWSRLDRTEFLTPTSVGHLRGYFCSKRSFSKKSNYESLFEKAVTHSFLRKKKNDKDYFKRTLGHLIKKAKYVGKGKHMLLHDISKISLAIDMPL